MNVIIIDSDCRKCFPQAEMVKILLNDSQCVVHYLDPIHLPELESECRCVLLTALHSGVQKYHHDLIVSNPQVRNWLISIVNVCFKSEQSQLLENIDTVLSDNKISYRVLFDDAVTLERTAAVCACPVQSKKTCMVVSGDSFLAQHFAKTVGRYLKEWNVMYVSSEEEKLYESADVVVAVGNKKEDFFLAAPRYGMGRYYAWVQCSVQNAAQLRKTAYDTLTEYGWNLSSIDNVYASILELEEYSRQLDMGELSAFELINDENFVIWDKYGLPLKSQDYCTEEVCAFLNRQCCFHNLIKRF